MTPPICNSMPAVGATAVGSSTNFLGVTMALFAASIWSRNCEFHTVSKAGDTPFFFPYVGDHWDPRNFVREGGF